MSLLDSFRVLAETLAITVPTVAEAVTGKLTDAAASARLERWSATVIELTRIDLDVRWQTPIDWRRPYVIMSNHQSHMDIPVLYRVIPPSVRMVAKKELFRVPLFGKAMTSAGFIEVDRGQRERAIASLEAAAARVRGGASVWIAPEGTRSADGEIGALKKGGFMLARSAGVPILPIVLSGTRDALPRGAAAIVRGARVRVEVGAPIETEGVAVDELMRQVRETFTNGLARLRQ
jgi:1-acyl-sn-glycerol-3-phosphate acyltransferase